MFQRVISQFQWLLELEAQCRNTTGSYNIWMVILGHGFFLCLRWARALDLGSALPKKHVFFSAQHSIGLSRFSKKTVSFGR